MTYEEWMNEVENYGTRFERFLEEWDNGMDVQRMEEWLKSAYNMGLEHRDKLQMGVKNESNRSRN